jgi:hypothetical protein
VLLQTDKHDEAEVVLVGNLPAICPTRAWPQRLIRPKYYSAPFCDFPFQTNATGRIFQYLKPSLIEDFQEPHFYFYGV